MSEPRLHLEDLELARAAARGEPAALAALEARVWPAVERGLARLLPSADARRELVQALRAKMLVPDDGRCGIERYDGRAPLGTWLRVCATRLGLKEKARGKREAERDEEARLAELAPGVPDPELAYMKRHYGAKFQVAYADAVGALAPRERNLLRHAVIDALSIDQIAAIYHVHRATAARQLKDARGALVAATRERLRVALGVAEAELESILRVLMSQADLTLKTVLGGERP